MAIKQLNSYITGKQGEERAKIFIQNKGFTVVASNYKNSYGEIDIIAYKNNKIVAFEVKTHKNNVEYAISTRQKQRITNAFMAFLTDNNNFLNYEIRFDAILINSSGIKYIENAWGENY